MTDIFKDWPLKYATAKMAKIRKMYIFQNLVLDEKKNTHTHTKNTHTQKQKQK